MINKHNFLKSYILCVGFLFLLTGCDDRIIVNKDKFIIRINEFDGGYCRYQMDKGGEFIDTCGKFNIGDNIVILKK